MQVKLIGSERERTGPHTIHVTHGKNVVDGREVDNLIGVHFFDGVSVRDLDGPLVERLADMGLVHDPRKASKEPKGDKDPAKGDGKGDK